MPKSFNMETKEKFVELRAKDFTYSQISEELGVSKPTLIEWAKEFENDINNMKTLEIEALQEANRATWKHRLEFLTEIRDKLKEELDNRDFSDMSTKDIYEMYMKYDQLIAAMVKKGSLMIKEDPDEQLDKMLEASSYKTIEV